MTSWRTRLRRSPTPSGGALVLGVPGRTGCVTSVPLDALDAVMEYVGDVARSAIDPPLVPIIEKLVAARRRWPDAPGAQGRDSAWGLRAPESRRVPPTCRRLGARDGHGGPRPAASSNVVSWTRRSTGRSSSTHPSRISTRVWRIDSWDRSTAAIERRALVKLDMVAEDEVGVLRPTVTGLLFGTRWPQRWLPQAFIQSVAYRGESVGEALQSARYQLDAKDNDGPIDDQIEYACRFVARNQRVEASKHMGRRDWPQYDLAAVFEAVVNAVAHRDYSIRGSKVRLRMFSDRVELYSPGALPDSMRVAELSRKRSVRNPAIANLLARCPVPEGIESLRSTLMARKGDGVPAIVARSRSLSGKEPVYELFGNELRLTIYAADPAAEGCT